MLHKHPSAEKAQHYFGISEKVKHDAANFFIYIQPKFGNIYDTSILRALDAEFNAHLIRDKHLSHLATLLTGGIDHSFIEESHSIWFKYSASGVTTGEYIKLYQLIISYLSGEAHKKYWWRYKKYRDLNRAIRNLLLFDLAIGTSLNEQSIKTSNSANNFEYQSEANVILDDLQEFQKTIDDLNDLTQQSYDVLHQSYTTIQAVLETTNTINTVNEQLENTLNLEQLSYNTSQFTQPALFVKEETNECIKTASNHNKLPFIEILSHTYKKIQKVSELIMQDYKNEELHPQNNAIKQLIKELEYDLNSIAKMLNHPLTIKGQLSSILSTDAVQNELHQLLHQSSQTLEEHLHQLDQLKRRKISIN
jgi:hypothetical protein